MSAEEFPVNDPPSQDVEKGLQFRRCLGTRPPHFLGGAQRHGAPYSSRRAPSTVSRHTSSASRMLRPRWKTILNILGGLLAEGERGYSLALFGGPLEVGDRSRRRVNR